MISSWNEWDSLQRVVVGAMSHGNINPDWITRTFSVSRYPLSAACTVGKLLNALEHRLGVL